MNSPRTIDLSDKKFAAGQPSASCQLETYPEQAEKTFGLHDIAKAAGLAFFLAVSPVTAIADPWLMEKRRRDTGVTLSIYQDVVGRFITRSMALQIARHILEQAERERLAIADFEAARGVQWGDEE